MILLAEASVVGLIGLLMIGVLAFLVFVALFATAVKAPRFFLAACGLMALLGFLLLVSMQRHAPRHALTPSQPPQILPGEPDDDSAVPSDGLGSDSDATSPGDLLNHESDAEAMTSADSEETVANSVAPAWVGTTGEREGNRTTYVIEGELYATPQEADRRALGMASELARDDLAQILGNKVLVWHVPVGYVNDTMIEDRHLEQVQRDYGTMYRTHLLMKLTSEHRLDLKRMWRDQVVTKRIWSAGGILSLAVLLLGTVAGYLKLDDATRGYYSGRLKLAALAVATGGATAVIAVVQAAVG